MCQAAQRRPQAAARRAALGCSGVAVLLTLAYDTGLAKSRLCLECQTRPPVPLPQPFYPCVQPASAEAWQSGGQQSGGQFHQQVEGFSPPAGLPEASSSPSMDQLSGSSGALSAPVLKCSTSDSAFLVGRSPRRPASSLSASWQPGASFRAASSSVLALSVSPAASHTCAWPMWARALLSRTLLACGGEGVGQGAWW
jgi:hypothetical protein